MRIEFYPWGVDNADASRAGRSDTRVDIEARTAL